MNATIQTETLTDGSTVYNVVRDWEQVAHPASLHEAQEICNRINAGPGGGVSDFYTATMHEGDLTTLARLLVRYHNAAVSEKRCSFYGVKMDKALCRDTFSTIYAHGPYEELKDIETHFIK